MSFAQHLKVVTSEDTQTERDPLWSVNELRDALREHKVWTANIPGNTECWHKQLLPHVTEGAFTFEDFVEVISSQTRFDFSVALNELLKPIPPLAGGWYNSELAD
jgi:hypothetical protein